MAEIHRYDTQGLSRQEADLVPTIATAMAIARRRRSTFLWVFPFSACLIVLAGFFWPSTFRADAAVLLQKTRFAEGVASEPGQTTTVLSGGVSEEEVNSEIAVLTSREVLEATAETAKLDDLRPSWYMRILTAPIQLYDAAYAWFHEVPNPSTTNSALTWLRSAVGVERMKDSNILVVSFRAGDPRFAEAVLNALLKHYLDRHVAVHGQLDVGSFFTEQTTVLESEVERLQDDVQKTKESLSVADLAVERQAAMQDEMNLDAEALTLRRHAAELDGKVAALWRTIGDLSSVRTSTTKRPSGDALEGMKARVLQLQLEQIQLELKYNASSPIVIANQRQLEAARQALTQEQQNVGEESTTTLNPTVAALQESVAGFSAERAGITDRLKALESQRRERQARVWQLDARVAEMDRLQLKLQSAKERYVMYLSRSERARVDAALDRARVSNVSVVQWASASPKPVSPRRMVTMILAIGGGIAIALLVCAWLELASIGVATAVASTLPRLEAGP